MDHYSRKMEEQPSAEVPTLNFQKITTRRSAALKLRNIERGIRKKMCPPIFIIVTDDVCRFLTVLTLRKEIRELKDNVIRRELRLIENSSKMEKIAQENALLSKDLESLIRQAAMQTTVMVSTSYMQMFDYI
jgi:hypothetical protein